MQFKPKRLETVEVEFIKAPGHKATINLDDFDEKVHKKVGEPEAEQPPEDPKKGKGGK